MISRKVFDFLARIANEQRTVTYKETLEGCGIPDNRSSMQRILFPALENIFMFCHLHDLPQLASIVVLKSGTFPGSGFFQLLDALSDNPLHKGMNQTSPYRKELVVKELQKAVFKFAAQDGGFHDQVNEVHVLDLLNVADEDGGMLGRLIDDKWYKQVKPKRYGPEQETAPLSHEQTSKILEEMRKKIAKEFGVTLAADHNGAWGQAGTHHMTLRFGDSEVSLTVNQVVSNAADEDHNAFLNERK